MTQIGVDIGSYTFNASLKTITFAGVIIDTIEQIKPIVNGKTSIVIFNPAETGKFGTLTANVLTLDYDTNVDSSTDLDPLYICVNLLDAELGTEETLAGIKAQTDLLKFTGDKLRTTGEDGGSGGSIPVYGARVRITVDDTGTINIPANASRVALRFSNDDGEECYFSFDGTTPVWKEDIQLKKKVTFIFLVAELGKGAINFVTNNGKTTAITYQEGI